MRALSTDINSKRPPAQVGIVGGGILGISLGYFLAKQGVQVEIFEASPFLGGLANSATLEDGTVVDRFYHTILSCDSHVRGLCTELGVADGLYFKETTTGFYYRDEIYPMNNIVQFLQFPPLSWVDRFRLGLTVVYAQFVRDWYRLESIGVQEWLVRLSGQRTFENIWRPMLRAKFDGGFDDTPATYIWSRLVRMKSTRDGASQKEMAGYLVGGYSTLLKAMARRIEALGGKIHLSYPVQEIVIEQGGARGVRIGQNVHSFDAIAVTLQSPIFRRLIPAASQDYLDMLGKTDYLGIICPLLALDRPLTGSWTLYITDDRIPFTGIIETTAYINPQHVGGHHLVYLPKYTAPGSRWQQIPDEEIREIWLQNLETMFPHFQRNWIRYMLVHRERHVEPLHPLNSTHLIPPIQTPIRNLFLANTGQIYPALTNGESVTRHARQAAQTILEGLRAPASSGVGIAR